MKAVTVAALVLSFLHGLSGSPTVSKRVDFDKKLKEKLEKFRHLEIVNGKFERMKASSPDEEALFKRVESLAVQKESSFAMSIDNFQGNDLVSDKVYRLNPQARPFTHKNNQFEDGPSDEDSEGSHGKGEGDEEQEKADELENHEDEGSFLGHLQEPEEEGLPENLLHAQDASEEEGGAITPEVDLDTALKQQIANNITGFHMDVIKCMDEHERSPSYGLLSFEEISDDCLGIKKRQLRAFYNDIAFQTKQYVLDRMKRMLKVGACDENFVICVEYFRAFQLATEMGLSLIDTMRANSESIANIIGEAKLNFLYIKSVAAMRDYEELVRLLAHEKTKFMAILAGKGSNHQQYSGYTPNKPPPTFTPPPPQPEEFVRLGARLPGDPVPVPQRFDGSTYSESLRFAVVPTETKKPAVKSTKTKLDPSEFMMAEKAHVGKGKKKVEFPESSDELDAMHMKAHELMKYRLKEQSRIPLTSNVFRKKK